ncbi:hypothetical protein BT63DRAFT_88148 [Microthyrium microscopicum]|uniref:Helix-turn-helix domain-containing protein n=1 Tax=Microthyrium microscopicum TaxID=703497 RepID=A0A6A6TZW1_9PEZI|nr:hypothetical protein BT63DRAFT_88148 [Microthyrium microscopicum]
MGASKSKIAKPKTHTPRVRTFPSTPSPAVRTQLPPRQQQPPTPPSPPSQQQPPPSTTKPPNISSDLRDPAFAARLHSLGVVPPNPFIPLSAQSSPSPIQTQPRDYHPSSSTPSSTPQEDWAEAATNNPALLVLRARAQLQRQHEEQEEGIARAGFRGRRFVDVGTLREAVRMKGAGVGSGEIEKRFGLEGGVVGRIGRTEVVDVVRDWEGER